MQVFAFDRDWTVDVNPHPRHRAVPLDWVRHLAHETDHAVYAIGNQDLAEEAAIPGVVDIVGRHPDDWDDWLGEKQRNGRYERFPLRRERLALIEDLHPDADAYVVVDDLDLSDVEGWQHYHAWEFVPAVEQGDIDPTLPWTHDPVADGGLPTKAGIVPPGASELKTFLEEYTDAPGFELTYTEDDTERTRLLWDVSVIERTVRRPAAKAAVRCTPIEPGEQKFGIAIDRIKLLNVVEPPEAMYTAGAESDEETAIALHRQATTHPDAVDVSAILAVLDTERRSERQERAGLHALHRVAECRPEECTPAVPILQSLLADECSSPRNALGTLRAIAEADAAQIAPHVETVTPYLTQSKPPVRLEAARCLTKITEDNPGDVVDAVPGLATLLEDDVAGQQYAVYALSCVTREVPEAVKPVTDTLSAVAIDTDYDDSVRLNAMSALGRLVGEQPTVGVDIADDIAGMIDSDTAKLRNNAIALLGDIAKLHTDVVEPYSEAIAAEVTVDDAFTRINASCALARIADDFPDSVEPEIETFIELLTDEHEVVRKNACWALGHLKAEAATDPLQKRAKTDDVDDVRERAHWALSQINDRD